MKLTFTILIFLALIKYLGALTINETAILWLSLPGATFIRYQPLIIAVLILTSLLLGNQLNTKSSRVTFTVLVAVVALSMINVIPLAIVNQWTVSVGEIEESSLAMEHKLEEMISVPYFTVPTDKGLEVIVSSENDPLVIEELRRVIDDGFQQ